MKRLLADAEKLSGVEYDIKNLNDVIEAIHVMQESLGITGTTALEASTTISGSWGMLKSAWSNLMTSFADENSNFDDYFNAVVDSAVTFGDNIIPRIQIVLTRIGEEMPKIVNKITDLAFEMLPSMLDVGVQAVGSLLNGIIQSAPRLIDSGIELINNVVNGLRSSMNYITDSAFEIMNTMIVTLTELLPDILDVGIELLTSLADGISNNLPSLFPVVLDLIITLCDKIIENLPTVIDSGLNILKAITKGIVDSLPTLINEVPRIINTLADTIRGKFPDILKTGIDILKTIIKGMIDSIPLIIENLPAITMAIINVFEMVSWWNIGKNLITGIGNGIKSMASNIKNTASTLAKDTLNSIKTGFSSAYSTGTTFISSIKNGIVGASKSLITSAKNVAVSVLNGIKNTFSLSNLKSIGSNLVEGIWNGINNKTTWIVNKIKGFGDSVLKAIKGFFGIHSPSRLMASEVGQWLPQGIAVGFEDELPDVNDEIANSLGTTVDVTKSALANDYNIPIASNSRTVTIEVPVLIDGREVARSTAPYQDEFDNYNTRNPIFA